MKRWRIKPNPGSKRTMTIPAAQFKARCLELMDDVSKRRQEFIITRHGKPVAKLVPIQEEEMDIFGYLKDTVTSYGDLISPVDELWDALQEGK